jgi:hypothetical protein
MRGKVERYRSVDEMSRSVVATDAADGFERFARHCARYWVIAPRTYPRGVFKYHSIEEARAARELMAAGPPTGARSGPS